MRVLVLMPTNRSGGAENVIKVAAAGLYEMTGAELHVVLMSGASAGAWASLAESAQLHFTGAQSKILGAASTARIIWRLSASEFDLAMASHTYCNGFLGLLRKARILRTHKLVARESTLVGQRFQGVKRLLAASIYRWCYGSIDLVICQTQGMRAALVRFAPKLGTRRLLVLPNPINLQMVKNLAQGSLQEHQRGSFIVAIGRLVRVKGYDTLIHAFALTLLDSPHLSLVIIGEGPERSALEKLISDLRLSGRVLLPGHMDNPFLLAKSALAGVVSSRIEGFPNVVLEMLAIGLPIVSTACADGLEDLPNVTLCPPEDVGALSRAISLVCARGGHASSSDVEECLARRSPRRFLCELLGEIGLSTQCDPPRSLAVNE